MEGDENKFGIPGAIVAAGIIIALSILYTSGKRPQSAPSVTNTNATDAAAVARQEQSALAENAKPVSSADHLLGNPNAPVKMIEYTDLECVYCKKFHPELEQIMNEYGKSGKVAWVFRHFPLSPKLHPKAMAAAIAAECTFNQLGEIKFWDYVHALFNSNLTNEDSDDTILADNAVKLGASLKEFKNCVISNPANTKIQANIDDGLAAGVAGTPYTIVVASNGKRFPINGAQPYEVVKATIDMALKEK